MYTARGAAVQQNDLGKAGRVAVDEIVGCTCCAEVVSKDPLRYRYVHEMVTLKQTTENKKLKVLACPECDEPMIQNARMRAGKGIDE